MLKEQTTHPTLDELKQLIRQKTVKRLAGKVRPQRKRATIHRAVIDLTDHEQQQIDNLNAIGQAMVGKSYEGWLMTSFQVRVKPRPCFSSQIEFKVEATNGSQSHKFFYVVGCPLTNLMRWGQALLSNDKEPQTGGSL